MRPTTGGKLIRIPKIWWARHIRGVETESLSEETMEYLSCHLQMGSLVLFGKSFSRTCGKTLVSNGRETTFWCSKVNLNGLECLWRLRKLKVLKLRDMDHIQDIKLVCLMLLEENPDLRIEGVDYEDTKILEA